MALESNNLYKNIVDEYDKECDRMSLNFDKRPEWNDGKVFNLLEKICKKYWAKQDLILSMNFVKYLDNLIFHREHILHYIAKKSVGNTKVLSEIVNMYYLHNFDLFAYAVSIGGVPDNTCRMFSNPSVRIPKNFNRCLRLISSIATGLEQHFCQMVFNSCLLSCDYDFLLYLAKKNGSTDCQYIFTSHLEYVVLVGRLDIANFVIRHGYVSRGRFGEDFGEKFGRLTVEVFKRLAYKKINFGQALRIIKWLFKHGADIHYQFDTIIGWAGSVGNIEIFDFLVQHGADVKAQCNNALSMAVSYGHVPMVKHMRRYGCDVRDIEITRSMLFDLERNGHLDMIKYLATNGIRLSGFPKPLKAEGLVILW